MNNQKQLIDTAKQTLINNDLGGYTVPTHGLYPFQWNWDSAITALGWMTFDEERAWQEIELLFSGQWDNGMIPHVLFHKESDTYFPGPDVWGSDKKVKSTSISQPPVLASVMNIMFDQCKDRALAAQKMAEFMPKLIAYHLWWYRERDPKNTGLVVSYHPWESGMDNSPAWDEALAAVPPVTWDYQRCDTTHINASERPHKKEYDRFLYLVEFFKNNHFDSDLIYENCPYKVNDIGIVSILHRASKDLLALCDKTNISHPSITELNDAVALTETTINGLWCEQDQYFYNRNVITGELCKVKTSASQLILYAGLANKLQADILNADALAWTQASTFSMSSTHPKSPLYEPQRYWRGPIWLHINWMIAIGFDDYQFTDIAKCMKDDAIALVNQSGYYEYFHADSGAGCGGKEFSWTAAIALYWWLQPQSIQHL
ncbi:trehalase family glycosidase [Paraglaciecola aquimarina]|uniref:Trehalase family glycosidase n=1 Tax=Paraglaciecola aquimarina TaxID=1235557 RepID=A0ABU3SWC3_9ALTE|nr:trehalase family glycosidase [Paraglaciecola aquimarina]MDU0354316.1 trehalase family glycosidase [Paraglaciecola aquimarina]